jgi:hypothetical protein
MMCPLIKSVSDDGFYTELIGFLASGLEKSPGLSHNETMKTSSARPASGIPVFSVILFFTVLLPFALRTAQADQIKVRKVKGKNAIVESSIPLEEGQVYEIVPEPVSADVDFKTEGLKSRSNSLSFGSQFSYLKSDTTESTNFSLQVRYGWNFSSLEVGALISGSSVDTGSGATTAYSLGGYFDYNLVNNRDPRKTVYGAFALAAFGSSQPPGSSTAGSTQTVEGDAGAFLTYFIGDSTTALRGEGYFVYQQSNTSTLNSNITGAGARGLLIFYF